MFYLVIILTAAIIIIFGNMAFIPFEWGSLISLALSTATGIAAIIAVDGVSALLLRRLTPKSWYSPARRSFSVSKRERNFYNKLHIKAWKELVPELGLFTGFSKSAVKSTSDRAYLERFLIESNYGVVIHLANALLGFLIMFIPWCSAVSVWLPIVIVNFVLSLMPAAILRHTSYTLQRLYERSLKSSL